ncbi:MAG: hypothetical protein HFH08_03050 [Bacilli bacterium]|nr:hypothetical protein [Bacilli bacterium]
MAKGARGWYEKEIKKLVISKNSALNYQCGDEQQKNPYIFKINRKLVRIIFSVTNKTATDCLIGILENLYKQIERGVI